MSRCSIQSMEERLRFETLFSDLSTRFVNLPTDKIDGQIVDNLKRIALVLEIDRCSVAEYNADNTKLRVTHWYAAPGVTRMPDVVINKPMPWYNQKLLWGESIIISRKADLPDEEKRSTAIKHRILEAERLEIGYGKSDVGPFGGSTPILRCSFFEKGRYRRISP